MTSQNPFRSEQGQSLIAALVLAGLVAIAAYTLMKLHAYQMMVTADTKRKDRLFVVGDNAMQRAMSLLVKSDSSELWGNVDASGDTTLSGFRSLTFTGSDNGVATPFSDVADTEYWIKIVRGDVSDNTATPYGAADDNAVANWINSGDLDLDRTIFVRIKDKITKREETFYSVIHRSEKDPTPFSSGIAASGCIDLGSSWSGDTYDSCLGAYGGTNHSDASSGGVVAEGTVQSPCISGGGSDFTLNKDNSPVTPPPSSAVFLAKEINKQPSSGTYPDINANTTVGTNWPSFWGGGAYLVDDFQTTGNKVIQIDVSRGPVHIYVHGTLDLGGNIDLLVIKPNATLWVETGALAAVTWTPKPFAYNYTGTGGMTNDLGLSTRAGSASGLYTPPTNHRAITQTGSTTSAYISLTAAVSDYYWYSHLTTTGCASCYRDLRGYRNLVFDARSLGTGSATLQAGLVYITPTSSSTWGEVTLTTQIQLSTTAQTFPIDFESLGIETDVTDTAQPIARVSRIVLTDFTLNDKVGIDNVYIGRYVYPNYCCEVEDAIIFEMNGNTVGLSGNGDYQCMLYAPDSAVVVGGGGNGYFNGAIVAKSFDTSGGGAGWFHADSCLSKKAAEFYKEPPLITTRWRQVGRKY